MSAAYPLGPPPPTLSIVEKLVVPEVAVRDIEHNPVHHHPGKPVYLVHPVVTSCPPGSSEVVPEPKPGLAPVHPEKLTAPPEKLIQPPSMTERADIPVDLPEPVLEPDADIALRNALAAQVLIEVPALAFGNGEGVDMVHPDVEKVIQSGFEPGDE